MSGKIRTLACHKKEQEYHLLVILNLISVCNLLYCLIYYIAHTVDNSFMGFVITVNRSVDMKSKLHQALVYGENEYIWKVGLITV